MEHTKTPWDYSPDNFPVITRIDDENGLVIDIAYMDLVGLPKKEAEANAQYIVKAVNNFDLMLSALNDIMMSSKDHYIQNKAREVIRKIGEEVS